jgi:hypothetical protein
MSSNGHTPTDPEYWCAYLAAAIGGALSLRPLELAREELRRALRKFTDSQSCSDALRSEIAKLSKGEK